MTKRMISSMFNQMCSHVCGDARHTKQNSLKHCHDNMCYEQPVFSYHTKVYLHAFNRKWHTVARLQRVEVAASLGKVHVGRWTPKVVCRGLLIVIAAAGSSESANHLLLTVSASAREHWLELCRGQWKILLRHPVRYMPLSRRLDRCDRMIQNESRGPNGGNVHYVAMQITFLTCKFRNVERNLHCDVVHVTTVWVSSLTLDCNGVFAIKPIQKSELQWRRENCDVAHS